MITRVVTSVMSRLDRGTPDIELSASRKLLRRRAKAWWWPAVQMGVASAISWLIADRVVPDVAGYAPITAIGALGLGRERRLGRSGIMMSGLFLGVVAAELASRLIGTGAWQIGLLIALTALISGALLDRDLAVTYAVINVVVLVTIPGREGWVPDRMISGLIGVTVSVVVMLLILPPRPVVLVTRRIERAGRRSVEALERTAEQLQLEERPGRHDGDGRPLIAAARRLDDEIERSHDSVEQALEIVRWSPIRRRNRAEIDRLSTIAHELRPALRTASTIAHLGDRAIALGVTADDHVVAGIGAAASTLPAFVSSLLNDDQPPPEDDERAADALGVLLAHTCNHAIMIALQEEVRGLLADISGVLDDSLGGAATNARRRSVGAEVDGVIFGRPEGVTG